MNNDVDSRAFFACKSTSLFKWYMIINALRILLWRRPAGTLTNRRNSGDAYGPGRQ